MNDTEEKSLKEKPNTYHNHYYSHCKTLKILRKTLHLFNDYIKLSTNTASIYVHSRFYNLLEKLTTPVIVETGLHNAKRLWQHESSSFLSFVCVTAFTAIKLSAYEVHCLPDLRGLIQPQMGNSSSFYTDLPNSGLLDLSGKSEKVLQFHSDLDIRAIHSTRVPIMSDPLTFPPASGLDWFAMKQ